MKEQVEKRLEELRAEERKMQVTYQALTAVIKEYERLLEQSENEEEKDNG